VLQGLGLTAADWPRIRRIDPEVGVWHTVKLTVIGNTVTAEYDGEAVIDRYVYPDGILSTAPAPIRLQKHAAVHEQDIGADNPRPIEYRNVFIREIESAGVNIPPKGFTALFNGKDLSGWRLDPRAKDVWFVEDGVAKAPGPIKEYIANLVTEKSFRDFVLLVDFRFPTISDSGIFFRGIPGIFHPEQFNLMSFHGTGNLDSLDHVPREVQLEFRDKPRTPFFYCTPQYYELEDPPVKYVDPEVGVWHTVKISLIGRTLSAWFDGEIIHDRFEYPDMVRVEPHPIMLQKHQPLVMKGKYYENMPIEFRNVFVKEIF